MRLASFKSKKSEHTIQMECIAHFRNKYERYSKGIVIPVINEAGYNNRNFVVCEGASDLIVVLPNKIIFIELKNSIGTQRGKQMEFETKVKLLGYEYYLCRNLDEFKAIIGENV